MSSPWLVASPPLLRVSRSGRAACSFPRAAAGPMLVVDTNLSLPHISRVLLRGFVVGHSPSVAVFRLGVGFWLEPHAQVMRINGNAMKKTSSHVGCVDVDGDEMNVVVFGR